jgi:hypothetical protein
VLSVICFNDWNADKMEQFVAKLVEMLLYNLVYVKFIDRILHVANSYIKKFFFNDIYRRTGTVLKYCGERHLII